MINQVGWRRIRELSTRMLVETDLQCHDNAERELQTIVGCTPKMAEIIHRAAACASAPYYRQDVEYLLSQIALRDQALAAIEKDIRGEFEENELGILERKIIKHIRAVTELAKGQQS